MTRIPSSIRSSPSHSWRAFGFSPFAYGTSSAKYSWASSTLIAVNPAPGRRQFERLSDSPLPVRQQFPPREYSGDRNFGRAGRVQIRGAWPRPTTIVAGHTAPLDGLGHRLASWNSTHSWGANETTRCAAWTHSYLCI